MRRSIIFLFLFSIVISSSAVPAKRGQWNTIRLADGTEVRAELRGDEHARWWQAEDGSCYVADSDGNYSAVDLQQARTSAKRKRAAAKAMKRMTMRRAEKSKSLFQGEKRGLIILVDFPNQSFSMDRPQPLYNRIANEKGYSDHSFNGSIRDYFIAQSGGQFTLDFDVAGPVTMSHNYSYYGNNDEANAPEMIKEACQGVDSIVDFTKYDWDGDGEVEEVFVLYAGHGQADYDSNNDNLIWPHMYWLNVTDDTSNDFYLDGVKIDTYACSSELNGSNGISGIGTFCHEFSHCMGFPDMYDTGKDNNFGMSSWDLMDYGCYNGDGYTPSGYSGYEKMVCGWTNPIELSGDTTITNVQPLSSMGQTYIVYNQGNKNEYYILTNRQQKGYDTYNPGHGMLIEHIDYDENIWDANIVNTTDNTDYAEYGITNDHQRITIFHADNRDGFYDQAADAYPYNGNDSLTNSSSPAATVYNNNSDGSKYMNCAIRDITENDDGTVSFVFGKTSGSNSGNTDLPENGVLFHETFDNCSGEGGNDGQFNYLSSDIISRSLFNPDNDGWDGNYMNGGYKCAWFGSSKYVGQAITPQITLAGDTATLSFRAAGWNTKSEKTDLQISVYSGVATLSGGDVTLVKGEFQSYSLRLVGKGAVKLEFLGNKRFFLDDVLVVSNKMTDGIRAIHNSQFTIHNSDNRIYTISGQYIGTDLEALPKGIYIVGDRKVVK